MTSLTTAGERTVVALKELHDGDWKTVSVRPSEWPPIPAGTRCRFVEEWSNLYGRWVRIIGPNGNKYDVKPTDVEFA